MICYILTIYFHQECIETGPTIAQNNIAAPFSTNLQIMSRNNMISYSKLQL